MHLWLGFAHVPHWLPLFCRACQVSNSAEDKGAGSGHAVPPLPQSPRKDINIKHTFKLHSIWSVDSQENNWNCCHHISYFKAIMDLIRFCLGCANPSSTGGAHRAPLNLLAGFWEFYFWMEKGEGRGSKGGGKWEVRRMRGQGKKGRIWKGRERKGKEKKWAERNGGYRKGGERGRKAGRPLIHISGCATVYKSQNRK